jgi:hypothetical protein
VRLEARSSHCYLLGGNLRFLQLTLKQIITLGSLAGYRFQVLSQQVRMD